VPVYDYKCKHCEDTFEVTKRITDADMIESCPHCEAPCDKTCRYIATPKEFYGEKPEEPFYSIPLGKWVKGKNAMRREAKQRGMIEIGNENVEKLHDSVERDREKRSRDRYRSIYDTGPYQVRGF
jgi:putative FmdB family regulatory protein